MDFAAALAYLDAHDNLESGRPVAGAIHGLSLERMRGLVHVLGDPQDAAPVIHLTGTNGKGSTARMISALLEAHGLVVGTYASPHLESVTERIRRNGEPISPRDFAEVVSEIADLEPLFPDRPSYFDLLTAAAFVWFAREAVDVVVLEVGMLGRFDSTNVAHAEVAVVTNVGRDHTDGADGWALAIAQEKAGIIEASSTVVIGATEPDLVAVFEAEGGRQHWVRDRDFAIESGSVAVGGRVIDVRTPFGPLDQVFLPVHGDHQAENASLALAAVEAFFDRALDPEVVAEAFADLRLPGRFEVVARNPLVVLDGAHNGDGAAAFAATVAGEFRVRGRVTLVLGCLRRADLAEVVATFASIAPDRVLCARPDSTRAADPAEVAEVVRAAHPGFAADPLAGDRTLEVRVVERVEDAVRAALGSAEADDAVLVAGSLYTVGAARAALRRDGYDLS